MESLVMSTNVPLSTATSLDSLLDTPFDEDAGEVESAASQSTAPTPKSTAPPAVPSSGRIGTRSNPSPPLVAERSLNSEEKRLMDHMKPSGTGKDIPTPLQRAFLSFIEDGDEQQCMSAIIENDEFSSDPITYEEAMARPDSHLWLKAMIEELESILAAKTWDLCPLPDGRVPIGCVFNYRIKRKADGSIDRYKARMCAQGCTQRKGIDYTETFAPVARLSSLRTLLAIVAAEDLELHQMDVKTAFLNGDLTEDIYMKQPKGFVHAGKEDLVCKLNKSLYGLKQAGRAWYKKIDSALLGLGFSALPADNCVYIQRSDEDTVYILLYVDDILIACRVLSKLTSIKKELSSLFCMKDIGQAEYILGLQITRDRANRTLTLCQSQYIDTIVKRFGMEDSHPESTPCALGLDLRKAVGEMKAEEAEKMRNVPYSSAVGAIMYAMLGTRPDIAYAVSVLSQFMHDPRLEHWKAVKRVLRYLKGTRDHKLVYDGGEFPYFHGYTDSDWANDKADRRSTCGYVFFLHGGAINWRSRKQHSVALSSLEAEYVAACEAGRDAAHWRSFLSELGSPLLQPGPITIHCDNQGAIALAKNPEHHDRSKHIDIQYHWVRDQVLKGLIRLDYTFTGSMIADVLTKPLARDRHIELTKKMGVY